MEKIDDIPCCVCGNLFWSPVIVETEAIKEARALVVETAPSGYEPTHIFQCVLCGTVFFGCLKK